MRGRGGRGGSRGRGRGKMGESDDGDGMYGDEMEVSLDTQIINGLLHSFIIVLTCLQTLMLHFIVW